VFKGNLRSSGPAKRRQHDGKSIPGVGLLDNRKSNPMADTVGVIHPFAIAPPNAP
jgi:hypothetical protein